MIEYDILGSFHNIEVRLLNPRAVKKISCIPKIMSVGYYRRETKGQLNRSLELHGLVKFIQCNVSIRIIDMWSIQII